ncbi:MAG: hypothetical protein AAF349_24080 [Cyanobacteria bacterium P01_A01_bin.68]
MIFYLLILGIIVGLIALAFRLGYGLGLKAFLILPIIVTVLSIFGIVVLWSSYANMGFASTLAFLALPLLIIVIELPFYGIGLAIGNIRLLGGILWGIMALLPILFVVGIVIASHEFR